MDKTKCINSGSIFGSFFFSSCSFECPLTFEKMLTRFFVDHGQICIKHIVRIFIPQIEEIKLYKKIVLLRRREKCKENNIKRGQVRLCKSCFVDLVYCFWQKRLLSTMQTMNGYISNQGRTYVLQVGSRDHLHIKKKLKS